MDDEKQMDRVQKIPITKLIPFKDHPFRVVEDESMLRTTESISMFGVLTPLMYRFREFILISSDVLWPQEQLTRACRSSRCSVCWDTSRLIQR